MPGQAPEPDFYATHLDEMVETLICWFGPDTRAPAAGLARRIRVLSRDARRLLARLLNRKRGPLRVETLKYRELMDPQQALQELEAAGMIERQPLLGGTHQLALLRRDELLDLFGAELTGLSSCRKPEMVDAVLRRCPDTLIAERLQGELRWVRLTQDDHFQLLTLLYFGDQRGSLTQFVTEALGITVYPQVTLSAPRLLIDAARTTPAATDPLAAALQAFAALRIQCDLSHRMDAALKRHRESAPADRKRCVRAAWRLAAALLRQPPHTLLEARRQRALLRLGQAFERSQAAWPALRCYQASGLPPATERRLRLLWCLGQQGAAKATAKMHLGPEQRALDRDFSRTLLHHGIRRRNKRLDEVRVSLLEVPYDRPIEQQALDLLLAVDGATTPRRADEHPAPARTLGWHCENLFPLGLAGLFYWPVLYAPLEGAFTRRFQSTPHGLGTPQFLEDRSAVLADLEGQWIRDGQPLTESAEALSAHLRKQLADHAGTRNPLVNWQFWSPSRLDSLLEKVDPLQLLRLARFTLLNLVDFRTGFPDLVVCNGVGGFCCVEVKGPTDSLQPMQRQWLRALAAMNIEAYVLKIDADRRC